MFDFFIGDLKSTFGHPLEEGAWHPPYFAYPKAATQCQIKL